MFRKYFFKILFDNHFQPANEQILIKPKLFRQVSFLVQPMKTDFCPKASKFTLNQFQFVFKLSNRYFQLFRLLFVIVAKAKSPILSFKICEELSAVQTPEEEQIRDNKTRLFMS